MPERCSTISWARRACSRGRTLSISAFSLPSAATWSASLKLSGVSIGFPKIVIGRFPPGPVSARPHRCQASPMPGRHVRRVRRAIGAGSEETIVVIGIDVMHLHHPHQMHRIGGAGKAAVGLVDVVADRLGAGEPFGADTDGAGAMLLV